jgi:hypothetical protein
LTTWRIFDNLTNVTITGGKIQTSSTKSVRFHVGGTYSNAWTDGNGGWYVAENGTPDHYMTIKGTATNIALNALGAVLWSSNAADHYAVIGGARTNIPLDSSGRIVASGAGTGTTKVTIFDTISNASKVAGGALFMDVSGAPAADALLLEDGFYLLLETGDKLLLE